MLVKVEFSETSRHKVYINDIIVEADRVDVMGPDEMVRFSEIFAEAKKIAGAKLDLLVVNATLVLVKTSPSGKKDVLIHL